MAQPNSSQSGGEWHGEAPDYVKLPDADDLTDRMIAACRKNPDGTRVRWKYENSAFWLSTSGRAFLAVWDSQPGRSVLIDGVTVLP